MINKGHISDKEIAQIKALYPGLALFKWPTPDKLDDIVFKPINVDILKKVTAIVRDAELSGKALPVESVNEKLFDACVLWPSFTLEEKFALPVGIIPSLVKVIQEKSGYIDIDIYHRVLAPDTLATVIKDFDYWGDISEEEAEAIKKETPFALYRLRIGRWIFVVRPMTRIDIQISSQSNDDQLALARAVTMWPKTVEWDNVPAGIIEILGREVNSLSGWDMSSETEAL